MDGCLADGDAADVFFELEKGFMCKNAEMVISSLRTIWGWSFELRETAST